jgi:hypothetical protein
VILSDEDTLRDVLCTVYYSRICLEKTEENHAKPQSGQFVLVDICQCLGGLYLHLHLEDGGSRFL